MECTKLLENGLQSILCIHFRITKRHCVKGNTFYNVDQVILEEEVNTSAETLN